MSEQREVAVDKANAFLELPAEQRRHPLAHEGGIYALTLRAHAAGKEKRGAA